MKWSILGSSLRSNRVVGGALAAVLALPLCASAQLMDGFATRFVELGGGGVAPGDSLATANDLGLITTFSSGRELTTDTRELYNDALDFSGNGTGRYTFPDGPDSAYPGLGGLPDAGLDNFIVEVRAQATIQPGTYQIGISSDDGGWVGFAGIPVSNPVNFSGTPPRPDLVWFNAPRGVGDTIGTITVAEETTTTFLAGFYENGGGDSSEWYIRDASGGEVGFSIDDYDLISNSVPGVSFQANTDMFDDDVRAPALVAGANAVGRMEISGRLNVIQEGPSSFEEGLKADVYYQNLRGAATWEAEVINGGSSPDASGVLTKLRYGNNTSEGYPDFFGLSGNANNYGVNASGEIFVENAMIEFKDGTDDYSYLAVDLNGDGTIDGGEFGSETIINDNDWAGQNGVGGNPGGSPVSFATFSGLAAGGEWRAMEWGMSEGGGGDSGALYWNQNPNAPPFPLFDTEPVDLEEHLVPIDKVRAEITSIVEGEYVVDVSNSAISFELKADELEWDKIVPAAAPNVNVEEGGTFVRALDVDGSTISLSLLSGELFNGLTVDLVDNTNIDEIRGTPTFDLPDLANWDTSNFLTNGQLTYGAAVAGIPGDYNGNGQVEQGDLDLVLLNWGDSIGDPGAIGWVNDLPDGQIDQGELDGVLLSWGNTAGLASAAVPEPSSIALALLACGFGLGLLRRRG